ncbi:hypothetical protein [Staphylococcus sp. GDY8P131P]|uniref:hypothetical protein n=1 Tax=Staphylococcus sp. GDY8P131P TaxID=2804159 RepID=UPI001AEC31D6|nr:hypothetical protein [Staphylococcus sp. GDY8P131P]
MTDTLKLGKNETIIPHTQRGRDSIILMEMIKAAVNARGNETAIYTYERLSDDMKDFPLGEHQITIRWSDV